MAQHIHNAVVDEFGDPSFDDSLGQDQSQETELQDIQAHHTGAVVDLEEFPWATGMGGNQAEPVALGVQSLLESEIMTPSSNRMRW